MVSTLKIEGHRVLHTNKKINKATPIKLHLEVNDNHTFYGTMHVGGAFGSNVKVWGVILMKPRETKLRFAHAPNGKSPLAHIFYNLAGHKHHLKGHLGELPKRPHVHFTSHQFPNKGQFERLVALSNYIGPSLNDGTVDLHVGTLKEEK